MILLLDRIRNPYVKLLKVVGKSRSKAASALQYAASIRLGGRIMPYHICECTELWQVEASDDLLAYQYDVYGIPHPKMSPWLQANKALRLLVLRDGVVAGSLDLVSDSPELGLPIEKCYPNEISHLRSQGTGLAEVNRFVTDHLRSVELYSLLNETARRLQDWPGDVAVCGVHPSRVSLYRIYMGWVVEALPKVLPLSDVAVILMTLTREGFRESVLGRRMRKSR